jgi:hypothetical protein
MPGSADAGNGIGGTADKVKILASCAIAASSITSSHIVDGAILNVDINASAAIALSKLAVCPLARSNHTGTQVASTISDFDTEVANNTAVTANTAKITYCSTASTKLATIETSATIDQTDAEIRTAVESATDSNVFSDADHTKLNAIEASATADQSNAEIKAAVEAATDSNTFTDADHSKLDAIEASATADQTGAQIKTLYEGETNAFTDALFSKLGAIEASATADQSNAEIRTAVEAATDSNVFADADHTKLDAIEASATADQTNGEIKTAYEANACTNALTCALSAEITANTAKISYCSTASTKLGTIEGSATADQSNGEIKTAYEANSDTNALTDALSAEITANTAKTGISSGQASAITANTAKISYCSTASTKLGTIEGSATADQSNAEIKTAYEANACTNALTCALSGEITANTAKISYCSTASTKLATIASCANNYTHSTNANLTGEVTSSGNSTTIASDIVDEDNLKISNAGTNGYFLSKQSGDTGGLTWATVPAGYSAPTIGSTSIASGSTNATITGLILTNPALGASYLDITKMSAPANPSADDGRLYVKTIDSNNDGIFIKIKKAGAFVEVQIA